MSHAWGSLKANIRNSVDLASAEISAIVVQAESIARGLPKLLVGTEGRGNSRCDTNDFLQRARILPLLSPAPAFHASHRPEQSRPQETRMSAVSQGAIREKPGLPLCSRVIPNASRPNCYGRSAPRRGVDWNRKSRSAVKLRLVERRWCSTRYERAQRRTWRHNLAPQGLWDLNQLRITSQNAI